MASHKPVQPVKRRTGLRSQKVRLPDVKDDTWDTVKEDKFERQGAYQRITSTPQQLPPGPATAPEVDMIAMLRDFLTIQQLLEHVHFFCCPPGLQQCSSKSKEGVPEGAEDA